MEQIATLWFLRLEIHIDRSHAPAWECRQGRSAFRFWKVTQSVTECIPTQSVGTIKNECLAGLGMPRSIRDGCCLSIRKGGRRAE
jgi:hypothetical protein